MAAQRQCWHEELLPALSAAGIVIADYAELAPATQEWLREYFTDAIFPVLTPRPSILAGPFLISRT